MRLAGGSCEVVTKGRAGEMRKTVLTEAVKDRLTDEQRQAMLCVHVVAMLCVHVCGNALCLYVEKRKLLIGVGRRYWDCNNEGVFVGAAGVGSPLHADQVRYTTQH